MFTALKFADPMFPGFGSTWRLRTISIPDIMNLFNQMRTEWPRSLEGTTILVQSVVNHE